MAVLPKENIHKMKLKLLLNRLLIFWGHLFSLRAVHSVTGGFCLFIFLGYGTIGCRMHLCQEIFAILILCQGKIIEKKHLPALAADNTSAFSHVFPLGALGCPGVCSLYYFPFQSFILI